jgi:protein-arginine kinase activator protein McsA
VEWDLSSGSKKNLPRDVRELELLLSLAVTEERYEEAARIQKRLSSVQNNQQKKQRVPASRSKKR